MASNGSVKYQQGTYGFIWKNQHKEKIKTGNGWVRGNIDTMNSYRAEAQGMVSCIEGVDQAQLKKTKLWTDNKSLVKRVNQKYKLHPLLPEWDLIEPLRQTVQHTGLTV